jgi:hypothetical protein
LVESTERVSAELNAVEQKRLHYSDKKKHLEDRLRSISISHDSAGHAGLASNLVSVAVSRPEMPAPRAETVIPEIMMAQSGAAALPEPRELLADLLDTDLSDLVRMSVERAASLIASKHKQIVEQIRAEIAALEHQEQLTCEAARQRGHQAIEMARIEAERRIKAEHDAAELQLAQAEADRRAALAQEQTNTCLRQAEMAARQRLDDENRACQVAEARLAKERELAELTQQRIAAEQEAACALDLKLQAEAEHLALANEQAMLDSELRQAIAQSNEVKAQVMAETEQRKAAEWRTMESGKELLRLETQARQLAEATEKQNQEAMAIARDLEKATVRALNMTKVRAQQESELLAAEQDKFQADALATLSFRKKVEAARQARDEASRCAEQIELLRHEEARAASEQERLQIEHRVALEQRNRVAHEAELAMQERIETERQAIRAEQDRLAAELAATQRAKAIIKAAMWSCDDTENFTRAMRTSVPEETVATQIERVRLEAEHHLLNECWKYAGKKAKRA